MGFLDSILGGRPSRDQAQQNPVEQPVQPQEQPVEAYEAVEQAGEETVSYAIEEAVEVQSAVDFDSLDPQSDELDEIYHPVPEESAVGEEPVGEVFETIGSGEEDLVDTSYKANLEVEIEDEDPFRGFDVEATPLLTQEDEEEIFAEELVQQEEAVENVFVSIVDQPTGEIVIDEVIEDKVNSSKHKKDGANQKRKPRDGKHQVFSVINQKGGVGKTTTAVNLAAALSEKRFKVLLVDLDPQGNSTSGLGVNKRALSNSVYDVLLNDLDVHEAIIRGAWNKLDIVPSTIDLAGAEVELVTEMSRESRLYDAVEAVREEYDYIIVDCPPSLGLLTVNGLVAADSLIIPIQSEFYALEGVTKLLESMNLVKARLNKDLDIYGVVVTLFDNRTNLARQVDEEVRSYFKEKMFTTIIPRTVKLSEAPSYGMPILEYDPNGRGSEAYRALAKEVITRG